MNINLTPTRWTQRGSESHYRTLVFVSHPSHLEQVEPNPSALVVSSDWLLVQEAMKQGIDSVLIDSCATEACNLENNADVYVRAMDWIYDDGVDMTLFRDVSLGRKFSRDLTLLLVEFRRLRRYVSSLIKSYKPEQVVFLGCELEMTLLDRQGCLELVQETAAGAGVSFIDRSDIAAAPPVRYGIHGTSLAPRSRALPGQNLALKTYALFLSAFSRVRHRISKKRKPVALMLTSQLTLNPLLNCDHYPLSPLVLFDWLPGKRSIATLADRLSKGLLVAQQGDQKLTHEDAEQIRAIESKILSIYQANRDGALASAILRYVYKHVIENKHFRKLAQIVRKSERLLNTWKPSVIFTDSLNNQTILIFLEIAKKKGVKNVMTWHAHSLIDTHIPTLGGDERYPALFSNIFTWGLIHEKSSTASGRAVEQTRTGNIIANRHKKAPRKQHAWRNVMVLQYVTPYNDIYVSNSNEFDYFAEIAAMLKNENFANFKMRLHPGTSKTSYYKTIVESLGINCELDDSGPFEECLKWADVVIGPIQSGAMLETISYGLPYFPVLLSPNAVNPAYLEDVTVYQDFSALGQAFKERRAPELEDFLEALSATAEFPDTPKEVWNRLNELAN